MQRLDRQSNGITDGVIWKQLLKFFLPIMLGTFFQQLYNTVDAIVVGNFAGKEALAAVGGSASRILDLVIGFFTGLASGATVIVSQVYGAKDEQNVSRSVHTAMLLALGGGAIMTVIGLLISPTLLVWMKTPPDTMAQSRDYVDIVFMAMIPGMVYNVGSAVLRAVGDSRRPLYFLIAACLTNIVLDALFVGVLGWGIEGAAIATVAGLAFGGLIPLVYFLLPNSSMLRLGRCTLDWRALRAAAANGSSEMVSNIAMSLVAVVYNIQLLKFIGEPGVAAYGVIGYVALVFAGVFMGYSVGAAPLMSFQHGNGNKTEMASLFRKGVLIMAVAGLIMFALTRIAATPLAMLFVSYDQSLMELTVHAFSIYSTAFLLMGLNMYASSLFTSLSNGGVSAALSFMRTLVFEIGCAFLLPLVLGPDGIWYSVIVAEVLALAMSAAAVIWLGPVYGILPRKKGSTGPVEP